ncbi:hypothetical protein [Aquisalibacillus elongatus]|uniref:Uncharacterized protein n=1 Tax=Aquisalibacillus elongatus TaxID=485577 RepID=A0A3N5BX06_9BACI|nr:hypothetical protein [Aquisalibacillus elongatus]RPF50405.1 hypothetical protein EDC24_2843 [Aquisalibacillus elongatus]
MFFYILFGIGIIAFIPVYLAEDINSFILIMASGTISGFSLVSFSIFVNKDWKGFRGKNGLPMRIIFGGIGVFVLIMTHFFWVDFPNYITNDYLTLEGVPSEVEYFPDSGKTGDSFFVTVEGVRLPLTPVPNISEEEAEDRYFVIKYFPYSQWIVEYKME